jgi:hypothetical protein
LTCFFAAQVVFDVLLSQLARHAPHDGAQVVRAGADFINQFRT